LLFVAADETEEQLEDMLSPHHRPPTRTSS
jgi:hypothetical protein